MSYPVDYEVEFPLVPRNRLSLVVRPLLAIPHLILVGGPALAVFGGGHRMGLLGAVAGMLAFFDWLAILVTGHSIAGLDSMKRFYLRQPDLPSAEPFYLGRHQPVRCGTTRRARHGMALAPRQCRRNHGHDLRHRHRRRSFACLLAFGDKDS